MTTHYILADDYDRWNPGEPIEDVASDLEYLDQLWRAWLLVTHDYLVTSFETWLKSEITAGNIIRIETDENGRILS